jgi:hypothetical protein
VAAVKITYYGEKVKLGAGPLEIVGRTDQKNEGSTETVESVLKNLRMILEISIIDKSIRPCQNRPYDIA